MRKLSLLILLALEFGSLFISSHSNIHHEVWVLTAFKRAIFEDPNSVLSDWNAVDGDPCDWSGVVCSNSRDRVLSLNLSGSSLKGFLAPEIGFLSSLEQLVLNNNLFLGTIPKEIGLLKNLTVLDLSVNRLTGSIPPEIGDLTSVTKVNLHSNGLTGDIPSELGKLTHLVQLRLDRNRLHGFIPGRNKTNSSSYMSSMFASSLNGLCQLPELQVGDFSYNFFVGKIPACLKYLPRSSFQGNCLQDNFSSLQRSSQICSSTKSHGLPKRPYQSSTQGSKNHNYRHPEWLFVLEVTTGVLVIVFCITAIITAFGVCKSKPLIGMPRKRTTSWKEHVALIPTDDELLKNVVKFTRKELEAACEDFSNIIGSSPDSILYKGNIKNGLEIAVISLCISEDQWTNYFEYYFQSKVADLARLSHNNIARLIGCCKEHEPFSRMLVFNYASNGTLYEHLHWDSEDGEGCQLPWFRRMNIILGIACGLRYLHTELQPPFAVSELNSSNIYLTEDFSPKIVDFESWKMILLESEKNSVCMNSGSSINNLLGPEQWQMDIQGNTFSFGVLLLEIISGRPSYSKDKGCLVDWAMEYLQQPEKIGELIDPELKNVRADDLAVICSVVSLCIEPDPSKRPSMQIICAVLENGIDTSADALLKDSSLAWAELALSS